ncbi:MAG: thiamine pyrophosphate-requiring protein [Chloroflexi bacterium]|nr:thiamine pyrophosphate-requiring protein [Chloroflexota bacterium]
MKRQVAVESTAEAYLELLTARGIDYFFGNGGTDFGPLIDAYAKRMELEQPVPKPVTVPHEVAAVSMAHGYTMVTGRPQAVMVHTIAGTANAIGGLINATRTQIPMLFTAGRTPLTEGSLKGSRDGSIHWAQESFDQGSMVREWVKWDYELRFGADLEGVVDRALAISGSGPQGPVYLTLPREVLAEERESFTYDDRPRMTASITMPSASAIQEAAKTLARATHPTAISRSIGRDPAAIAPLVRLAETLSLPVFDAFPTHMNFPRTHHLYQGNDAGPYLEEADAILVLESDVPWTPKRQAPGSDATIIAVGHDPLFSKYPVRGFPVDIGLAGSTSHTLAALADAVAAEPLDMAAVRERGERWAAAHHKMRETAGSRADAARTARPMQKPWVSACVEQLRTEETIIVTELGFDATQFAFSTPGSYFDAPASGVLGWGLGAALGAKLAAPDKTVIACVGDGSYMFGVPTAVHWVSRRMNLPVLFIVWNNAQWGAVAGATRGVYPDGWAVRTNSFPFSDLSPSLDFELVCQAAGGYGERVDDPAEVPAALERALRVVQEEKRQALLNIVAAPR